MARARSFGVFILVLCLVACVCAHGDVSYDDAKKAADAAQDSAKKVYEKVKGEPRDALRLQDDIDTCKENAGEAATEAEKAAKGNSEAETFAQKAKKASDEVLKLYPNAFEQAEKYLESMKKLRTKAKELDDKAKKDLYLSSGPSTNYTKIKEDADAIKSQAEALNAEINKELSSFSGVYAKEKEMLKFVSDAQLARYHVDAIVAVAEINTLLESADTDIILIEKKRDEIHVTEQEMNDLYDNSPKDLSQYISSLRSSVKTEFQSASRAIEKAKKAKERMLEQKAQANDALVKVKAETNLENAKKQASHVDRIAENAEKNFEEIKNALDSATTSAISAGYQKNAAVNELNKKDKKPDTTQNDNKMNPQDSANTHKPVKETTESPAVIEPKKPTITNPYQPMTEQPVLVTTESPTVIKTKQPTITNPYQPMTEQPVQVTTESPTVIKTKQPTITNPYQPMTEQPVQVTTESPTVIGTQQPTRTNSDQPRSGGTEPTQPSSSDNAMTVSVPLLLALIACAALH